jgi:hypothetical protein
MSRLVVFSPNTLTCEQQRNRPKEPPKPLEAAPFFLPTLPGVEQRFVVEQKAGKSNKSMKRLNKAAGESESVFLKKLSEEDPEGNRERPMHPFIDVLTSCRRRILQLRQNAITSGGGLGITFFGRIGYTLTLSSRVDRTTTV